MSERDVVTETNPYDLPRGDWFSLSVDRLVELDRRETERQRAITAWDERFGGKVRPEVLRERGLGV